MITVVKSKLPIVIPATVQRRAGLNTAAQRRLIDARLAEARKGPHYGPFDSVAEMQADIESRIKKISLTKTRRKL